MKIYNYSPVIIYFMITGPNGMYMYEKLDIQKLLNILPIFYKISTYALSEQSKQTSMLFASVNTKIMFVEEQISHKLCLCSQECTTSFCK
jgi:hypothetical protein